MIDIDRLSKRFSGRTVVNDLSFRIARGEIVGLLGPNGAGKSTTLKMLSGFLAPSAGSVRIFGFDMQDKARQAQKLIGYLPENAPSYGEMTVEGFLAFVASIRDYSGQEKRRRIDSAMDCMELRDERRSIIETLSKGFKRRVALAQAILHDPELLLLDEPTDGLDPNQKHQVRQLVKNLSESKIVVISTHILEEVSFMQPRPGDQRRPLAGRQHPGRTQDPQPLPPCRQPQHRSTGRPAGHRHAPRRRRYRRMPRPGRHPDHPGPPGAQILPRSTA